MIHLQIIKSNKELQKSLKKKWKIKLFNFGSFLFMYMVSCILLFALKKIFTISQ